MTDLATEEMIDAIAEQIIWHVHAHPGHSPDIYGEEAAAEIIYERSVKPLLAAARERDAMREEIEKALADVAYVPGDYPVVPNKHAAFVVAIRQALNSGAASMTPRETLGPSAAFAANIVTDAPASAAKGEAVDARAICEALGFDPTNHHNAAACPYCIPDEALRAEIKARHAQPHPSQQGGTEGEGFPTTLSGFLAVAKRVLESIPAPQINDGEIVAYSVSDDVPEDISTALSYIDAAIAALNQEQPA